MPRFIFDEGQHRFTVDGRIYPGVTGLIFSSGLVDPDKVKYFNDEAMWRGTRVHRACMQIDLGAFGGEALVEDAPYIESYLQWKHLTRPRATCVEEARFSRRFKFAGIADWVGFDSRGRPFTFDRKTGAAQKWHRIQTALYDILHDDLPWGVRRRGALYLQKDGSCARLVEHTDKRDYVAAFRLLKEAA